MGKGKRTNVNKSTNVNKKICFTAIFRNEGSNVYRCLDAAKPIIDYISITDTGSKDNTVELIKKWGQENNIPTTVDIEEFKNFSYNRTKSYLNAKDNYPDTDYFLLLDADMVLVADDDFDKSSLTDNCYLVDQKNIHLIYPNVRLLDNKIKWKCVGATHEYWTDVKDDDSDILIKKSKLQTMYIDDRNDGGHKQDKFVRDIRLLTDELNDPNISFDLKQRDSFYLAESYRNSGDPYNAQKWYRKRIKLGGFNEEIYMSYYNIGKCFHDMYKYEQAAGWYLKAWNYRPHRAEALYNLVKMYRIQGNNFLAYQLAKLGLKIKYPKDDILFVEYKIYTYEFDYELSIVSYYVGDKNLGIASCKKILSMSSSVSQSVIETTKNNIKHYM